MLNNTRRKAAIERIKKANQDFEAVPAISAFIEGDEYPESIESWVAQFLDESRVQRELAAAGTKNQSSNAVAWLRLSIQYLVLATDLMELGYNPAYSDSALFNVRFDLYKECGL